MFSLHATNPLLDKENAFDNENDIRAGNVAEGKTPGLINRILQPASSAHPKSLFSPKTPAGKHLVTAGRAPLATITNKTPAVHVHRGQGTAQKSHQTTDSVTKPSMSGRVDDVVKAKSSIPDVEYCPPSSFNAADARAYDPGFAWVDFAELGKREQCLTWRDFVQSPDTSPLLEAANKFGSVDDGVVGVVETLLPPIEQVFGDGKDLDGPDEFDLDQLASAMAKTRKRPSAARGVGTGAIRGKAPVTQHRAATQSASPRQLRTKRRRSGLAAVQKPSRIPTLTTNRMPAVAPRGPAVAGKTVKSVSTVKETSIKPKSASNSKSLR